MGKWENEQIEKCQTGNQVSWKYTDRKYAQAGKNGHMYRLGIYTANVD